MEEKRKTIESLCSFYVSDWHMVTMLLPYINAQVNENIKIATIFEKEIETKLIELLEKLNLKNKEEIKKINWKIKNGYKYEEVSKILSEQLREKQIILISGTKDFLDKTNQNIQKWYSKQKEAKIKIINCYEVTDFNYNLKEILDSHDRILNTSGEKEICEIFDGYKKEIKEAN